MRSHSPSDALGRRRALHAFAAASATCATGGGPLLRAASASVAPPHVPGLPLSDGSLLPFATFGVQIYDDQTAYECTTRALQVGFRSFFTSPEAGNQRGFARAIRDSGIAREELHIAGSILSDAATSYRDAKALTQRACDASLEDLAVGGISALDLLMLERPAVGGPDSIRGQWRALEARRASGAARSLGVCNFDVDQLDSILTPTRSHVAPVVNQIGYNLATRMPHAQLREQHAQRGVALQAWGPLGGPSALIPRSLLDECAAIGRPRRMSASQVALLWLASQGVPFVVHSRSLVHLRDDLAIFEPAPRATAAAAASGFASRSTGTSPPARPSTFARLSDEEVAMLERDSERAPAYY